MTRELGSIYAPPRAMRRRKRHGQAACLRCHLTIIGNPPACPACGAQLREPMRRAA